MSRVESAATQRRSACHHPNLNPRLKTPTVITPKDKAVQPIQAEKVEEIPRQRGHPPDVHVGCFNAALKHRLEPERQGKGQFNWKI